MYLLLSRNFGNGTFFWISKKVSRNAASSYQEAGSGSDELPQLDPYRDEVDTSTIAQAGQLKPEDRDSKDEHDPPSTK